MKGKEEEFYPFTIDEFTSRIDKCMEDSKNDDVIENDELISEIRQWQ